MTKAEFMPILEGILRQADSTIDYLDFTTRGEGESSQEVITIFYANAPEISLPVTNLSLMDILVAVSERCAPQYELRLLHESQPAVWSFPLESFEQWAETEKAQSEAWRFLKYRYRMNETEANYIFGRMALFLMQK